VLGSLKCDCKEQLDAALELIAAEGAGVVLYLRQEGRGIGLANKIRAYKLQQEQGLDTVDANLALGFPDDLRDYGVAAALLRTLGVRSVDLLTNNPAKVLGLQRHGMAVTSRVPHAIAPGEHNEAYLATKAMRSGHLLPLPAPRAATRTP
jgi:GTP cyclohydrolase II